MDPHFESAASAVERITAGYNLGNSLDATGKYDGPDITKYELQWGEPFVTKTFIEALKKAGFDAVRVPVTWKGHFDKDGNIDKAWLGRVGEIVDHVLDLGLYCIINVHHDGGEGSWIKSSPQDFEKNGAVFRYLWQQIAAYFKDYGERLLFEALNEPINEARQWLANDENSVMGTSLYNQAFVDAVRASGSNNSMRNLVVMPYAGSGTEGRLDTFKLPSDPAKDHIILEVHNYDPQGFCWYKAIGQQLRDTWGTTGDLAQIDHFKSLMKAFMDKNNVPAIVGEYGSQDKHNESERAKHAYAFTSAMREIGVKCFWWDCGAFCIMDRKQETVRFPEIVRAVTTV